jgi:hypothetical protein
MRRQVDIETTLGTAAPGIEDWRRHIDIADRPSIEEAAARGENVAALVDR